MDDNANVFYMTTESQEPQEPAVTLPSGLRYYGGWFFLSLSVALPLCGLAVPMLGLSKSVTAVLTGALVVGAPEIATVIAIALWGKETFNYFIGRGKGMLKKLLPPATVSPARYRLGLVLFIGSGLPCWLLAYFPHWVDASSRTPILVTADFAFIASFYVLGGDFWGKVRALFTPS